MPLLLNLIRIIMLNKMILLPLIKDISQLLLKRDNLMLMKLILLHIMIVLWISNLLNKKDIKKMLNLELDIMMINLLFISIMLSNYNIEIFWTLVKVWDLLLILLCLWVSLLLLDLKPLKLRLWATSVWRWLNLATIQLQ